jgi:hypothetical protein
VRTAPLLVLVLLLAGCASSTGGGGSHATTPTGSAAPAFLLTDLGVGGPEPVIREAGDGSLVVAAQDPEGGGPRVWASHDRGASFSVSRVNAQGGGEVDLAAGPGTLYVTQLGTTGNVVSVSRDGGQTWQTSPVGSAQYYFDREWAGVDDAGRAYLVSRVQGNTQVSQASRSDDNGLTFLPQGNAWDAQHEPGLTNGNLVAWNGGIAMPYVCRDGNGVCVATTRDKGATWTQALVRAGNAPVNNMYAALAATDAGLLVAWSEAVDGRLAVFDSTSADGRSWSAPVRVSSTGESALEPWPAARGGTAWIVYVSAPAALASGDAPGADHARWTPMAARVDARGAAQGAPRALSGAVHVGPVSPPVGAGGGAQRDRLLGDFFTALVDARGKLVVAVESDPGPQGPSHDVVLREP